MNITYRRAKPGDISAAAQVYSTALNDIYERHGLADQVVQFIQPNPYYADAAFAMLAGMQLDVFTPLQAGPKTAEDIAYAIGVGSARLRLLLYSLVAAGLLMNAAARRARQSTLDMDLHLMGHNSRLSRCRRHAHQTPQIPSARFLEPKASLTKEVGMFFFRSNPASAEGYEKIHISGISRSHHAVFPTDSDESHSALPRELRPWKQA